MIHFVYRRQTMIDLRSDTLTLPDRPMLETILTAHLGDDGRLNAAGRGEDSTVNRLEDMSAALTGKEAGLLCTSGTLGNQVAVLTWCRPGDTVLVNDLQHLDRSEKTAFDPRFGQMKKAIYHLDANFQPDLAEIEAQCKTEKIKLLCLENTHNYTGGTCITEASLKKIHDLASQYHVPVHMDGARLFNASLYLKTPVDQLCQYVDSVQFCFSKGLGAPVGSVLCGSRDFIRNAKETRKLMGGAMRQAGIIAAPAIYALEHNIQRLQEDHDNCAACAAQLQDLKKITVQKDVQTNILMLDVAPSGITPQEFCDRAKAKGLWIRPIINTSVRLVFYKGITRQDALDAAAIIRQLDAEL